MTNKILESNWYTEWELFWVRPNFILFQSVWMCWAIDTERFQKLSVSLDVLGHRHRKVSETFSQSGCVGP